MTRDIADRIAAALENPAVEFEPDGTPKLGNLMRDALAEIQRLRALVPQQDGAREAAIEECAKIAETAGCGDPRCMSCYGNQIAATIRDLRTPEQRVKP